MDKEKAGEILDGGETNDLKKPGSLVRDPRVVVQLLFDGEEYSMVFGEFGLEDGDLDYLVHREKGVSLGEQDEFYDDNLVEADVYVLDNMSGEVTVQRFEATPSGWVDVEEN